jgi:hypothetical protein
MSEGAFSHLTRTYYKFLTLTDPLYTLMHPRMAARVLMVSCKRIVKHLLGNKKAAGLARGLASASGERARPRARPAAHEAMHIIVFCNAHCPDNRSSLCISREDPLASR